MHFILAAALAGSLGAGQSPAPQGKDKEPAPKKELKLAVGDPAPALKATKWLQGDEVKEFVAGKAYVVEFWTAWCHQCIAMMPHASELQAEYRDKGVTFIMFSARDPNSSLDKVAAFVEVRGPRLGLTFAYAENNDAYLAWVAAARQVLPCSFVVGKDGKIAYIGHPQLLDEVLPKVAAGTWTKEDAAAMAKLETELQGVFTALTGTDPVVGLKTLSDFQAAHPRLAGIPYFVTPKIGLLLQTKKTVEARNFAEEAIARAVKRDDASTLMNIASVLRSPQANSDKDLLALSLKAAQASVKASDEKDAIALLGLARTYYSMGDKDKAKEAGAKAVAATVGESDGIKDYVRQQVKKFEE